MADRGTTTYMTVGTVCTGKAGKKAASILTAAAVQRRKMTQLSSAIMKIKKTPLLFRSAGIVPTDALPLVSGGVRRRSCAPWVY